MCGRHMENPDLTKRHLFSDKVYVDLDVLGAAMLNRIRCHVYGADIVAEHHSGERTNDVA